MSIGVKGERALGAVAAIWGSAHNVSMTRRTPKSTHYIRAWRKHRGLTLEQLAERIGMSHQNLGKVERGRVPYNQTLLELLAEELRCEPVDLIIRDPSEPEGIWSIWDQLRPTEQRQVTEIAKTIRRTGTEG
jgi:transcriptional regulator with XRE-family HTH domain